MRDPRHVLVITARYPDDPESTELDYAIECPGVTDLCRSWVECRVEGCGSDDLYDEEAAHGVRHSYIDALGWCVPTEECYPSAADELCEVVDGWLGAGRYKVEEFFYCEGGLGGVKLAEAPDAP